MTSEELPEIAPVLVALAAFSSVLLGAYLRRLSRGAPTIGAWRSADGFTPRRGELPIEGPEPPWDSPTAIRQRLELGSQSTGRRAVSRAAVPSFSVARVSPARLKR
jgi:hypothetical protein